MKGREIRERLQTRNIDPELMYVLCSLGEEMSHMRQQIKDLSVMVDQITTISVNLVGVGEQMKKTIMAIQGRVEQDEKAEIQ